MKSDKERQKQAIANAFRAACLSTHNKSLKSIATQYQDLLHIPYSVDDPHVYTEALELARTRHNAQLSNDPFIHQPHYQSLQDFIRYFAAHNPHLSPSEAKAKALREVNIMQYEIEDKYAREHANKVPTEYEIFKILDKRLKNYGRDHKLATIKREPETELYPGWQQCSIIGMANASRFIDKLHKFALDEVKQGGKGHAFRESILKEKMPEIGPKEVSLAWYLLAPQKADLAIVDDLILEALDHKVKDFQPRNYGLAERQLMAGRDASGYNHIPLSLFQKGLLDQYQGPTNHSTIAAWDPHPVHQTNWDQEQIPLNDWPNWWRDTKPYRDQVLEDWNRNEAIQHSPREFIASYAIRYSTIGPNTDQLTNDPLANITEDDPRNPNPPSALWQTDEICPYCNNSQIMEINGKTVSCPNCQSWADQQQFDPSTPDPALENPAPGVLNPSPDVTGP